MPISSLIILHYITTVCSLFTQWRVYGGVNVPSCVSKVIKNAALAA